jgi:hypothetical protein
MMKNPDKKDPNDEAASTADIYEPIVDEWTRRATKSSCRASRHRSAANTTTKEATNRKHSTSRSHRASHFKKADTSTVIVIKSGTKVNIMIVLVLVASFSLAGLSVYTITLINKDRYHAQLLQTQRGMLLNLSQFSFCKVTFIAFITRKLSDRTALERHFFKRVASRNHETREK